MDTVTIGNVGKPIGRDYYEIPLEFIDPAQLRCRVTSRPLWTDTPAPPTDAALNIWLVGPGTERLNCLETPLIRSKELSCMITKRGRYTMTFQSANSALAVGFGFTCSQQPLKLDSPPLVVGPAPANQGTKHPLGTAATSKGSELLAAPKLVLRLDVVNDGSDDKHKILTLVPCAEPLKAGSGSIKIGKSSSRRYIVHKSKTCEVEVSDVPENLLQSDTPVILTP